MCDREKIFVSRFVDAFFDRLCRRGGFLGDCAIHGCPSARNCGDCRDAAAQAGTAEAAATPAPTADAVQPPQGLVETGAAGADYDEIRLLRYSRELQSYPEVEYYTMCKDGKWGLMRSDGSEVLPCRAPEPLFECGLGNRHWHDYTNGLSWEAADALRKEYARQLQACGDGVICDGHDGDGYLEFVYLQEHTVSIYSGSLGPGEFSARQRMICCGTAAAPTALCPPAAVQYTARATTGIILSAMGNTPTVIKTALPPTIPFIQPQIFSLMHR